MRFRPAAACRRTSGCSSPSPAIRAGTAAEALRDKQPTVRLAAARILIGIGPEAHEAIPALIAGLRDEDLEVLGATLSTLVQIGPSAQAAVPALTDMLADRRLLGYTHTFGVGTRPRPSSSAPRSPRSWAASDRGRGPPPPP